MANNVPPPMKADYRFLHPLRVRWGEVDGQGVVFNPHYLAYADIAITEYMRTIGIEYPARFHELGFDFFAVAAAINFRSPARFDDELLIGGRVDRVGRTSFGFQVAIFRGEETMADIQLSYVNTDLTRGRPAPLPAQIVEAISRFEGRELSG